MLNHFGKTVFGLSLLFTAVSCGRAGDDANEAQNSKTLSLVGFPCQDYGFNPSDDSFVCGQFNTGSRTVDVLFRLDGMNSAQKTKMASAIKTAASRYSAYWTEAAMGLEPVILQCVSRNAKTEMIPSGSSIASTLTTQKKQIVWALTTLIFGFDFHSSNHRAIVVSSYNQALNSQGAAPAAHAVIGNDIFPAKIPMDFAVNLAALSRDGGEYDYSSNAYAGFVVHEMLHRRGYTHSDPGRSSGPMVYEVGNCISSLNWGLGLAETVKQLPAD